MKTTLDLPDELMRAVKIRAVNEGRRLKDVMADLLKHGLAHEGPHPAGVRHKVQLPLVRCTPPDRPEDEMTADRVAEILEQEDATAFREPG